MIYKHASVMLNEVLENLKIKPDGIYVDGTLGGGGHTFQIAARLTEGGRVIGIDQDADAIAAATKHLRVYEDRATLVRDNFENMANILHELGIDASRLDSEPSFPRFERPMIAVGIVIPLPRAHCENVDKRVGIGEFVVADEIAETFSVWLVFDRQNVGEFSVV